LKLEFSNTFLPSAFFCSTLSALRVLCPMPSRPCSWAKSNRHLHHGKFISTSTTLSLEACNGLYNLEFFFAPTTLSIMPHHKRLSRPVPGRRSRVFHWPGLR
jgi:hypothetical protein